MTSVGPFRRGVTHAEDPVEAVADLRRQLAGAGRASVLFFCSPTYDLDALAAALRAWTVDSVVGCTTAGQLGPGGFHAVGITAVAFDAAELSLESFRIDGVAGLAAQGVRAFAEDAGVAAFARAGAAVHDRRSAFALLLIDGLSRAEEVAIAALYRSLGKLPIIGGSAGDDLRFERTHVYHDGAFRTDVAVVALLRTDRPIRVVKFQDLVPTPGRVVVTDADEGARRVHGINGVVAADAYAAALGVAPGSLTAELVARHPLMLCIGDTWYVRSARDIHADGSISFYCAIAEGLVLSVGRAVDPVEVVRGALEQARRELGQLDLLIGFDCVLRHRQLKAHGLVGAVGDLLDEARAVGFNTYGEQHDAVHVNQTFTGVAIGEAR